VTKRRWLVVLALILAALATAAVVLYSIPYSTDLVDYGGVTSIR
jgi:peptidoglycan/LPS O-acetylase OafA/YrhL